eukprot:CAMPEP_0206510072 /NCGR_PEP_ID=MMETSP0324_2-20121206/59384_1 /ASSEMBLY_ACC=CAM_ASM_000836 /TAXON_ID=2866 /ORGANISM="Crypthecodinium cohnii, Strain Seligo" /LENGTH=94 /DNA_ID=CAMNT_0054001405 /DNA_START=371 /DNA_END=654 /DNA_ORIENTATION=+
MTEAATVPTVDFEGSRDAEVEVMGLEGAAQEAMVEVAGPDRACGGHPPSRSAQIHPHLVQVLLQVSPHLPQQSYNFHMALCLIKADSNALGAGW